jgi:hypothetical protein
MAKVMLRKPIIATPRAPTQGGLIFADRFEMEMVDQKLSRRISHNYDINVLT